MKTLFEKVIIGENELTNRIVMAPMTRNRANENGDPNDLMVEYYKQRAGFGLIITEGTAPIHIGKAYPGIPGIYTEYQINAQYFASGVKWHFYYQNNTFFGLDDDIPNTTMNESDGIADVYNYISINSTNLNFNLQHIGYPNQQPAFTNVNLAYFLTYTSPCQPFETSLFTFDTTTCANAPLQLGASGGIAY